MLSSSVEVPSPGGMSGLSVAARNVVRSSSISGAMYSLEKSPGGGGSDSTSLAGNKKRRSSLGAKMVAIVGLSQWSKSTQQLNQQGQSGSDMSIRLPASTFLFNGQLEFELQSVDSSQNIFFCCDCIHANLTQEFSKTLGVHFGSKK